MKKSLVAPLLLALLAVPAAAQDTTAQAATQEKRIQELEKKVDDLTAKKAKADEAKAAAEAKASAVAEKKQDSEGFSYRLTGRAFLDGVWFSGSNNNLASGVYLRNARLGFKATMGPLWYAESEFDFAGGAIAYKDIFLQYNGLKNQVIQVGNVKAPMGLETMMSDNARRNRGALCPSPKNRDGRMRSLRQARAMASPMAARSSGTSRMDW